MLPAPAQGAIVVVCRHDDTYTFETCHLLNDGPTALCTKTERDFLRALLGGCSTPISALATIENGFLNFKGNILSLNGRQKIEVEKRLPLEEAADCGLNAAEELLARGGKQITDEIRHATS
jgi:hydroxymethylbilane synthase